MSDKYTILDYPFDAKSTYAKRVDLKYHFAIDCKNVSKYTVDAMYELLRGIFTFGFNDEMNKWLQEILVDIDFGNDETRQILESALSAARKNTVHSHESAEMYD